MTHATDWQNESSTGIHLLRESSQPVLWFCLRAHPKHEHIAAAHLRQLDDVEVFCPRIRIRRLTRSGPKWFTEPLFPGYLFAKFDWQCGLPLIRSRPGITDVVHFGTRWPIVPQMFIDELRPLLGSEEVAEVTTPIQPGDEVVIGNGMFHGLKAVVTHVVPARQRVKVLLDFLGQLVTAEVRQNEVVKSCAHPMFEAGPPRVAQVEPQLG